MSDDDRDHEHLFLTMNAFYHYGDHMRKKIELASTNYGKLSEKHKSYIPHYKNYLENVSNLINVNCKLLKDVLLNSKHFIQNFLPSDVASRECVMEKMELYKPSDYVMGKLVSVLHHIVRDWGVSGAYERSTCYAPIIHVVSKCFIPESSVKILVPGAGLGRLAWELASIGYTCQGNEQALDMLFVSQYILNYLTKKEEITFYPWIGNFSNRMTNDDQLESVTFPDVSPRSRQVDNFSMVGGDFLEIYTISESWSCVVTCFFIDTAHNVLEYIDRIYDILEMGGIWVNLGPLLYHYSGTDKTVELSYEDIRRVVETMFVIEYENNDLSVLYIYEHKSMLNYGYNPIFFAARKVPKDFTQI